MLWNVSNLHGYVGHASDGSIGAIDDFLFDDANWRVRWLVLDTGSWLPGRRVVLPPAAIKMLDATRRSVELTVSKQQVEDSPGLDKEAPVSRQFEDLLFSHYGWQPYWAGYGVPAAGGPAFVPPAGVGVPPPAEPPPELPEDGDPHLRSAGEVTGYYIHARDGEIGHVEDFLVDSHDWTIRYVVVDTKNWWPGKKVLVKPDAFHDIEWTDRTIQVELSREKIKGAPEYDPMQTVDRKYEEAFHAYYGYPYYW